jgi:hypothetical protein
MSVQLPLPAAWATRLGLPTKRDPHERLDLIERDKLDARAEMVEIIERLAEKHGVKAHEIDRSMEYVDSALDDLVYDIRGELEREIEDRNPIE